jgi:hypothetical protein
MKNLDHKKEFKNLYTAKKKPKIVEVPEMNFIMIDGKGDPNTSQEFKDAVEALYPVAYKIKFMIKKGKEQIDYKVMPLEGLWWAEDMEKFRELKKNEWLWTLMIMQPDLVTEDIYEKALEEVKEKKDLKSLPKLRFESHEDELSAQIMHLGPYSEEALTIDKLHKFIKENGYKLRGKHREIYLSDMRRTAPEKLKTIIRQPMEK